MGEPYVRVSGIGIDVCIIVVDEIDAEIVRLAMDMAAKRAAAQAQEGKP